ncbi:thiolase family protein [Antrihabitans stalactiti]|uniref:Thiolase family protein n=1 Tax=Antrihabitans stalactiti TaxID=2584121 RepID=A0A848KP42_9NOCA|nr:thiolase family protein [Antrihabitans stalactiti]NMN98402.1 thiolase family protein [Antrihabitans stalactiti]
MTEVGKVFGYTATDFAAEAVRRASADAGLRVADIDGLLISSGLRHDVGVRLQDTLGLRDLRLNTEMNAFGASAGAMVAFAAAAVTAGAATTVACVFADSPLQPGGGAGKVYAAGARPIPPGPYSYRFASGAVSPNVMYAMAARRHMATFGTTSADLGTIAVAQREWAALNPLAQQRKPLTLAEHQASPWIADPLHLLDCCLVSNGGAAVIVTTSERARDLAQPPVDVLGWGQGHPGQVMDSGSSFGHSSGAAIAGPTALRMAGLSIADVDLLELYDCYTFTVLLTLEDYGFCPKGEGGRFVTEGHTRPGGRLPCNTGGGQLSGYYLWGFTPLGEAILQARGQAGERQVENRDVIMVSGNGGILEHHSTLVLSPIGAGS